MLTHTAAAQVTCVALIEPAYFAAWRGRGWAAQLGELDWDWQVQLQLRLPQEMFQDGPRAALTAAAADAVDGASPGDIR